MTTLRKIMFIGLFSATALLFTACSEDKESKNENNGDHVWKHQTDALKTAKEMAKKMQDSLKQQQEKLDENN